MWHAISEIICHIHIEVVYERERKRRKKQRDYNNNWGMRQRIYLPFFCFHRYFATICRDNNYFLFWVRCHVPLSIIIITLKAGKLVGFLYQSFTMLYNSKTCVLKRIRHNLPQDNFKRGFFPNWRINSDFFLYILTFIDSFKWNRSKTLEIFFFKSNPLSKYIHQSSNISRVYIIVNIY